MEPNTPQPERAGDVGSTRLVRQLGKIIELGKKNLAWYVVRWRPKTLDEIRRDLASPCRAPLRLARKKASGFELALMRVRAACGMALAPNHQPYRQIQMLLLDSGLYVWWPRPCRDKGSTLGRRLVLRIYKWSLPKKLPGWCKDVEARIALERTGLGYIRAVSYGIECSFQKPNKGLDRPVYLPILG